MNIKDGGIITAVMTVVGVIGYQPILSWAEDQVAEIATVKVSERIDKIEEKQQQIFVEQQVTQQKIEGVDGKLEVMLRMMQQQQSN